MESIEQVIVKAIDDWKNYCYTHSIDGPSSNTLSKGDIILRIITDPGKIIEIKRSSNKGMADRLYSETPMAHRINRNHIAGYVYKRGAADDVGRDPMLYLHSHCPEDRRDEMHVYLSNLLTTINTYLYVNSDTLERVDRVDRVVTGRILRNLTPYRHRCKTTKETDPILNQIKSRVDKDNHVIVLIKGE